MKNIQDETIRDAFLYINYKAYVFFYYHSEKAEESKEATVAFKQAKGGALKWIGKLYNNTDFAFWESALEKSVKSELVKMLEKPDEYKSMADLMIRMMKTIPTEKLDLL